MLVCTLTHFYMLLRAFTCSYIQDLVVGLVHMVLRIVLHTVLHMVCKQFCTQYAHGPNGPSYRKAFDSSNHIIDHFDFF